MKKVITVLALFCAMSFAQNTKTATAELEKEAKKWQLSINTGGNTPKAKSDSYKESESQFFLFESTRKIEEDKIDGNVEVVSDSIIWTATSKVNISECPANSVWKMYHECDFTSCSWGNKIEPKCKTITPKIITDYYIRPEQYP